MIISTALLAVMFVPLSILTLLNAFVVNTNTRSMRISIGIVGTGLLCMSVYYVFRSVGLIDVSEPLPTELFRVFLLLVIMGLYSVFGAPVVLAFAKREIAKKSNV